MPRVKLLSTAKRPSQAAPPTAKDDDSDSWSIRIRKECIFAEQVDTVASRVELAASFPPAEELPAYGSPRVTPLYLLVECAEAGRAGYGPLPRGLSEGEAQPLARMVLTALLALHERGIVHGHLDAHNVLVRADRQRVRVTEHVLPVSLFVPGSERGRRARMAAAPEIRDNLPFSYGADVWSLAVLLLNMVTPASKTIETDDIVDTDLMSPLLAPLSSKARALLIQCFKADSAKRPLLSELAENPFFMVDLATRNGWSSTAGVNGGASSAGSDTGDDDDDEEEADGNETSEGAESDSSGDGDDSSAAGDTDSGGA